MHTSCIAFVYFARKPRPMSKPVSGHHAEKFGERSSARQQVSNAADQKKIDNGSIVITSAPAFRIGSTFTSTTVHAPIDSPYKRRARFHSTRLVPSASRGLKKRMPNSLTPNRCVESHIVAATPGPF